MYYSFTALMGLWSTIYYIYRFGEEKKCVKEPNTRVLENLPQNEIVALMLTVYVFIAIFSMVFAMKKLFRSNYNTQGRSFFFKKQLYYVIAFAIMWQFQILSTYLNLFNNTEIEKASADIKKFLEKVNAVVAFISGVALLGSGIVLAALRLKEPLF